MLLRWNVIHGANKISIILMVLPVCTNVLDLNKYTYTTFRESKQLGTSATVMIYNWINKIVLTKEVIFTLTLKKK